MGYPDSVPGNEDPRLAPRTEPEVLPEPVHPVASRHGVNVGLGVGVAILVAVGALVAKPWAGGGGPAPGAGAGSSPATTVATAPAFSSGRPASASPDVLGV